MRRSILLLIAAAIGSGSSFISATTLVPRVRSVEVVTLFFSAFAAGATLVAAFVELKRARQARKPRLSDRAE